MNSEAIHTGRSFYAPRFILRVDGRRAEGNDGRAVEPHVIRDVIELTFEDNLDEYEFFEFTLSDWDPVLNAPKYSSPYDGAGRPRTDGAGREIPAFEPGMAAELVLGYYGPEEPVSKLLGTIVTVSPSFPESGLPQMKVRVISNLFQLQRGPLTRSFSDQTDTAIAQALAGDLGIGVATPAGQSGREVANAFVMLNNEPPVKFLARRARLLGYDLVMLPPPPADLGLEVTGGGAGEPVLFFGPSESATPTYRLGWGKTLIHFDIALRIKDQVGKVTVQGLDPTKSGDARNIKGEATLAQLGLDFPDPKLFDLVVGALEATETLEPDAAVRSQAEAEARARGLLLDRVRDMVTAEGGTVGFPHLRAGATVRIDGVGPRYSADWVLTKTTHRIDANGYTTRFSARMKTRSA
jgi:phage protein D